MRIRITDYSDAHTEAVLGFNARLRAGGMSYQFPTEATPRWLPPVDGRRLYQQQFVALDESDQVRGAYILKHQDFKVGKSVVSIGDFQLPISEGSVDRNYAGVGGELLFDALAKQPSLYGLGIGGYGESVAQLFRAAGWRLFSVPFLFKVLHPFRFCRGIRFLRRAWRRRLLLDLAAWTGAGWLGIKGLQAARSRPIRRGAPLAVEAVADFDDWTDALWFECQDDYGLIAVRNREVLNVLYPRSDTRFLRLRISDDGKPVGWCVFLDTPMENHKQFGTLRVGSFVDGLASVGDTPSVVRAATAWFERRGADLIVCNHSHVAWCQAFAAAGYLRGPSNYLFAGSKALSRLLDKSQIRNDGMFINRGDGDGPINL